MLLTFMRLSAVGMQSHDQQCSPPLHLTRASLITAHSALAQPLLSKGKASAVAAEWEEEVGLECARSRGLPLIEAYRKRQRETSHFRGGALITSRPLNLFPPLNMLPVALPPLTNQFLHRAISGPLAMDRLINLLLSTHCSFFCSRAVACGILFTYVGPWVGFARSPWM